MLRTLCSLLALFLLASAAVAQGSICAHGGGADWNDPSHREMVRWMVERARRMPDETPAAVILGAVPREPDEPDAAADAFRAGGAVPRALVITADNADDPAVAAAIEGARIVWIRGGDQGRYVTGWKGRATERAIRKVFESGGVVGGTSAGCAVLGEVTYDARNNSLRPEQALTDAHHQNLTLTDGFLNLVPGVLFDTHFAERGRIGRLPVMMARAKADFGKSVLGVGIDHGTALVIDPRGTARIIGQHTVTFLMWHDATHAACEPGQPLVTGMGMTVLPAGAEYDLTARRLLTPGVPPERLVAMQPPLCGTGVPPQLVQCARAWARDGHLEHRMRGTLRELVQSPMATGVLWGPGATVLRDGESCVRSEPEDGTGTGPALLALTIPEGAQLSQHGPLVIVDARLHILPAGWGVNYRTGETVPPRAGP